MKDGNVIADETKRYVEPKSVANNIDLIGDNIIRIAPDHQVSKEEVEKIVKILNSTPGEKIISCDKDNNEKFNNLITSFCNKNFTIFNNCSSTNNYTFHISSLQNYTTFLNKFYNYIKRSCYGRN